MHLHTLTIETYRALRAACVTFDEPTVPVGESGCGKSSLLETFA